MCFSCVVVSASVLAKDMLPPPPVEGIRKLDVAEVQDSALKGISVDLLNKVKQQVGQIIPSCEVIW